MSAEPVAWMNPIVRQVMRHVDDAKNRKGMIFGMPKVQLDCSQVEYICNVAEKSRALAIADIARHKALINKAVNVLGRQLVPDGISDHEALNELHGIFDGPEYRALSPAPSVTEEWIEDRLENLDENGYTGNGQRLAILATLAALGITVEGAAK